MTRPVALILDTSAVLSFVRSSMHVGEVIAEVADERGVVAIPVSCLVEAAQHAVDDDQLTLLVEHPDTLVLVEDAENWRALAALVPVTGGYAPACAALAAIDFERWVLSARPELYAGVNGGALVIPIGE